MAFVRKKTVTRKYTRYCSQDTVGGYERWKARQQNEKETTEKVYHYYYLVENYRDKGKVRQRTLACLGHYPTVAEAVEGYVMEAEQHRKKAAQFMKMAGPSPQHLSKQRNWAESSKEHLRFAGKAEQRADHLRQFLECSA